MKKLIIISDLASDPLYQQQMRSMVEGFVKDPAAINLSFVHASTIIEFAYTLATISQTEEEYGRPLETVILQHLSLNLYAQNVFDIAETNPFILRLQSGLYIIGTNASYNFSLIKPKIDEIYEYTNIIDEERKDIKELFSRLSAHLMDSMEDEMDLEESHTNKIPELNDFYVGHIDALGNIETTIREESLKEILGSANHLDISINGVKNRVLITENLAMLRDHMLMYSSRLLNKENPYYKIINVQLSRSGAQSFNFPKTGDIIKIG